MPTPQEFRAWLERTIADAKKEGLDQWSIVQELLAVSTAQEQVLWDLMRLVANKKVDCRSVLPQEMIEAIPSKSGNNVPPQ